MGASFEERLDELIALAADAGRLGSEAAAADHAHAWAASGDAKTRARRRKRAANEAWTNAEQKLNRARDRFLAKEG